MLQLRLLLREKQNKKTTERQRSKQKSKMAKYIFLMFVLYFLSQTILSYPARMGLLQEKHKNAYRQDTLKTIKYTPIINQCLEYCVEMSRCYALSFSTSAQKCLLHTKGGKKKFSLVHDSDYNYFEIKFV
ncbi:uncharacterized protein LOC130635769 [Hydractinia symbiolongicarpus]|uniref:uncharacterized protein LOC130635769 n=1 Tax=Hydractinia symbiolongicarpus TaxID=13093 RepID=UPI00254D2A40|nr:uncharacterized protein LOC130635769 [Hydractinia symbiolongicarpus]